MSKENSPSINDGSVPTFQYPDPQRIYPWQIVQPHKNASSTYQSPYRSPYSQNAAATAESSRPGSSISFTNLAGDPATSMSYPPQSYRSILPAISPAPTVPQNLLLSSFSPQIAPKTNLHNSPAASLGVNYVSTSQLAAFPLQFPRTTVPPTSLTATEPTIHTNRKGSDDRKPASELGNKTADLRASNDTYQSESLVGFFRENSSDDQDDGSDAGSDTSSMDEELAILDQLTQNVDGEMNLSAIRKLGQMKPLRKGQRGPRKHAELTGEIKLRLSEATQAFLEEDYVQARNSCNDIIALNAETYEAYTLLASVFRELGDVVRSLTALVYAAHLRPRDVQIWLNCARFALEDSGDMRSELLTTAKMCYSAAVRANPLDCWDGRIGKAAVLREMGQQHNKQAITEYLRLLKDRPHNLELLRYLAEAYVDEDDAAEAIALYQQSIEFYKTAANVDNDSFSWSDLNIYVEVLAFSGNFQQAIEELKTTARWLLGRNHESIWENFGDDREWDLGNDRRSQVAEFDGASADISRYGLGLPMELRVKLGMYRVRLNDRDEGIIHLNSLDPGNLLQENRILDYPDLFRRAADTLQYIGLHQDALRFYQPLEDLEGSKDASLLIQISKCYESLDLFEDAQRYLQEAIEIDDDSIEARINLALLYEKLNNPEQTFALLSQIKSLKSAANVISPARPRVYNSTEAADAFMPPSSENRYYYRLRARIRAEQKRKHDEILAEHLRVQYSVLLMEQDNMRAGQTDAVSRWLRAAQDLIEDFQSFRDFFPPESVIGEARTLATISEPFGNDIAAVATRVSQQLGVDIDEKPHFVIDATDYRGIAFSEWLDIFVECALCLAKTGRPSKAYHICEVAKDAIVFRNSRENMFLIYICWCTCALLANDVETCLFQSRYFIKDYQFTSDCYKMFSAIARASQSPISWFTSEVTQTFLLQQIKTMDYGLIKERNPEAILAEKPSYSAQDTNGRLVINTAMDVTLLLLYGHVLNAGMSYAYALNYFLRAYALEPQNPMIQLTVALTYIHWGLKNDSEISQHNIMQGISFLCQYYDNRKDSDRLEERQEAHYNMARSYHTLGLTHIASQYYHKALEEMQEATSTVVYDAAYNLQSIYITNGNFLMAKRITDTWLII